MERKEFLQLFGVGATLLFTGCLGGCATALPPSTSATAPDPVLDLSLNLTDPAQADLHNLRRGYVYVAGGRVIVAKTLANSYLAVAAACPHEGEQIRYYRPQNRFECPAHSSRFQADGTLLEGPSRNGLRHFRVTQTGNLLHIWG
ncbi:ubiquinol-cytochrome c reductase iron-sulfur subunit [uncultured Hymenobacter sp.]|uniref:QcrA and Rieske domain-containing protein n=1 Tax=uncultured Hymenobacter sp. TaxID=170016 RepID=UPI0035CB78B5